MVKVIENLTKLVGRIVACQPHPDNGDNGSFVWFHLQAE